MQMRHGFATVWPVIDDQAVTGLRQSGFFRHFTRLEQQVSKNLSMFGLDFGNPGKHFLGKNQKMSRRLWFDVLDRENQIILVNNRGRNLPGNDFFEQRFAHAEV